MDPTDWYARYIGWIGVCRVRDETIADNRYRRTNSGKERCNNGFLSSPLNGNETALLLFDRGMTSYEPKNDSERIVFSQIQRVRAVSLQNAWQQYELGLINSDTFEYSKRRILAMYDTCGIRPIVTSRATNDFLQFLESNSQVQC